MLAAPLTKRVSLLEFVNSLSEVLSAPDERGSEAEERRVTTRFAPSERVVVRLDVLGGVWSAGVLDLSERATRIEVDPRLADRVQQDERASLAFETPDRGFARLNGRLSPRRPASLDSPAALTFTFDF